MGRVRHEEWRFWISGDAFRVVNGDNPVNWYPWCEAAFVRARTEDKPVFLSIGYSTCHWCHVMAHESFEDMEIAQILNRYYVSIKVDKEERGQDCSGDGRKDVIAVLVEKLAEVVKMGRKTESFFCSRKGAHL